MQLEYILDDLYEEAYYTDDLWDINFFVSDAERVCELCIYYDYDYWEAIYAVLNEVREELYYGW